MEHHTHTDMAELQMHWEPFSESVPVKFYVVAFVWVNEDNWAELVALRPTWKLPLMPLKRVEYNRIVLYCTCTKKICTSKLEEHLPIVQLRNTKYKMWNLQKVINKENSQSPHIHIHLLHCLMFSGNEKSSNCPQSICGGYFFEYKSLIAHG